jgi:hypothetical protein
LTTKETEGENEHSEEWLDIFSIEAEETATWDFAAGAEEELEKTLEAAQGGEESEHSEEWLNDFSQEAEEAVALKLTAEEAEDDEHSEEWLNIFSRGAERTATGEVAEAEEEGADIIFFADLWDQIEALGERVKVQGMHIQ